MHTHTSSTTTCRQFNFDPVFVQGAKNIMRFASTVGDVCFVGSIALSFSSCCLETSTSTDPHQHHQLPGSSPAPVVAPNSQNHTFIPGELIQWLTIRRYIQGSIQCRGNVKLELSLSIFLQLSDYSGSVC